MDDPSRIRRQSGDDNRNDAFRNSGRSRDPNPFRNRGRFGNDNDRNGFNNRNNNNNEPFQRQDEDDVEYGSEYDSDDDDDSEDNRIFESSSSSSNNNDGRFGTWPQSNLGFNDPLQDRGNPENPQDFFPPPRTSTFAAPVTTTTTTTTTLRPGFGFRDTTEDPFRRTTEDPFRNNENRYDDFQNSEDGNRGRPTNPFGGPGGRRGSSRPPLIRNRPQVDEFGNPLEDIHSVDTTRFELGEGINADEVRCPRNWERFAESCYKFTRSPIKRWDDARLQCQAYRHQDQVSLETENSNFLTLVFDMFSFICHCPTSILSLYPL